MGTGAKIEKKIFISLHFEISPRKVRGQAWVIAPGNVRGRARVRVPSVVRRRAKVVAPGVVRGRVRVGRSVSGGQVRTGVAIHGVRST